MTRDMTGRQGEIAGLMPAQDSTQLRRCAERIVARVGDWLEKNSVFVPEDVRRRRRYDLSWRPLVRAVLGTFARIAAPRSRRLIVFQGTRDKLYHRVFSPGEVMIIGSDADREYARANGHAFASSSPVEGAVRIALSRRLDFFLLRQLRSWAKLLREYEQVGLFLYEDTQPLGAFFANVAALAGSHVNVVCIQHGYFPRPLNDLPLDGSASQVNFVWDQKQAELIGCSKAFAIGPPVSAIARSTKRPQIILVGTGTYYDGTGDFERTLSWYRSLLDRLPEDLQTQVLYRPHPNEMASRSIADRIQELFPRLDLLPLAERLGGDVAVFVGSLSSVLFEAGYAGHVVVRVGLREDAIAMFERHAEFSTLQLDDAAMWLEAICRGEELVATPAARPKIDFRAAAHAVLSSPQ